MEPDKELIEKMIEMYQAVSQGTGTPKLITLECGDCGHVGWITPTEHTLCPHLVSFIRKFGGKSSE